MKDNNIIMYMKNNELDIDKVVDDFSAYLYTIISKSANFSKEDIEEIISDTYFILWNNQHKLDINKKMSAYLVGIVKNLIKKKYAIFYQTYDDIENFEEKLIEKDRIDVIIENHEINSEVINILRKMKKQDRDIFYEFYYHSLKIKEIAIKYKISESQVKVRLYRIRNKLRKELMKGGFGSNG